MARAHRERKPVKAIGERGARKAPQKKTASKATKKAKAANGAGTEKRQPSVVVALPEALDSSSAGAIRQQLLAHRGSPLVIDAGQVRRTGMQAVQVLLAAAQTWRGDGQSYVVTNSTNEFLDTLALVGLSRQRLSIEGFPE
jgi:chemotaxis protein CheX